MKLIKWLLLIAVGLIAILFIGTLFLSNDYALERSVTIDAKPEQVHIMVGDLANWEQWSPWKELDPSLEVTIPDQSSGIGATQNWKGKDGEGTLTLTRSDSGGIEYDMVFFAGDEEWPSKGSMLYDEVDQGTTVTWGMSGTMEGYLGKIMAFMMPSMVGKDFDRGLAKLKNAVESMPLPATDSEVDSMEETTKDDAVGSE